MFTKYALPLLAVAGLGFALFMVVQGRQGPPPSQPLIEPPTRPEAARVIAGAGLIESREKNIPVGSNVPGIVWEVYVKIHDKVAKGDPLFRVDDRELKAQLAARQADLQAAEADLRRLEAAPRESQNLDTARAAIAEAQATLESAEVAVKRSSALYRDSAGPASDYDRDRFAYLAARAAVERAEADLQRIQAVWEQDKLVARAAVEQARAQVATIRVGLERLTTRALIDGEVLQVNVRPGQFAATTWNEPLIVLGDVHKLHVRVDIDEQDLAYYRDGARAVASLKGRPGVRFPLEFVKVEPYVIPKRSLTGDNSERVDTRVLQVIYALPDRRSVPVYVGQQMDVYLEAAPPPPGLDREVDTTTPAVFEIDPSSQPSAATR